MNNLDYYNLDDDLTFSPIDDENTDKKQKEIKHIYRGRAQNHRPDLVKS